MNIKINRAFGLAISDHHLLCNCSDGIVRIFHTDTLEHVLTIPKPPNLGAANQTIGMKKVKTSSSKDAKYADCIAVEMDGAKERLVAVYSDGMILIWDLSIKEKVKVMRAFLSHNKTIYDIEILPDSTSEITRFATCSVDKTIRFWNFYDYSNPDLQKLVQRNIYCKELEKLIYVSQDFDHFKVNDSEEEGGEAEAPENLDLTNQLR
jgi:WD40 repeat protein